MWTLEIYTLKSKTDLAQNKLQWKVLQREKKTWEIILHRLSYFTLKFIYSPIFILSEIISTIFNSTGKHTYKITRHQNTHGVYFTPHIYWEPKDENKISFKIKYTKQKSVTVLLIKHSIIHKHLQNLKIKIYFHPNIWPRFHLFKI